MKLTQLEQLSVLAATTGLVLAALYVLERLAGTPVPEWLPMMIAAVLGFELYMFGEARWRRRRGDGHG